MNNYLKKGITLILSISLALGPASFSKQDVKAADVAENMLVNGDFTDGLNGWNTYFFSSNCASAKVTDDFEFDMTVNYYDLWSSYGNLYKISWQSMLIQKVTIEKDKTYTLQFDAYASESKTIKSGIKNDNTFNETYNLTTEKTTYTRTFTASSSKTEELQFQFGYMEDDGAINPEGKHDIYISDMYFVEGDSSNIVKKPSIYNVFDNGNYITEVTPGVRYDSAYTAELYYKSLGDNDYSIIPYTVGDTISEDGFYKLKVYNSNDPSISNEISFAIDRTSVDMTKDYFFIKSRSNGKALEAYGFGENSSIIQSSYKEKVSQLFTVNEVSNGKYYIQSLSSGKVIAINNDKANGAKLVQQTYTGNKYQQWTKEKAKQGYIYLKNVGSGKVIDVPSASSSEGIQLQQYEANESNAQMWDVIRVDIDKIINGDREPDVSTEELWKKNVITYPVADKLVAAGPIYFKWMNKIYDSSVEKYLIQFDNEQVVTVVPTEDDVMEYEWYNTKVSAHTVNISAVLANGKTVQSDTIRFYVTKKGIGWGSLYRTDDMNLSWYYQWSMEESNGTSLDLQFVPMVWGNWGSEWLNNHENEKYKQVLGFNEPDFNEQSALSYTEALSAWKDFSNSGLRVGSPCTAIGAYWSQDWFWKFMDGIDADNNLKVDFITIHCYMDNASVDSFLSLIDNTWEKWHRPIWITEFGVAKWGKGNDIWNNYTAGANQKTYMFMKRVLPELDKRDYVERYAWFPFDPNDEYGGSSGIFNYDNGQLNELGKLYATLGNPEGYKIDKDYTADLANYEKTFTIKEDGEEITTPSNQDTTKNNEETTKTEVPETTTSEQKATTVTSETKADEIVSLYNDIKGAKPKISKAKQSGKKIKVTVKKNKKGVKYQVVYSKNKKFKKSYKVYSSKNVILLKKMIKSAKKGTTIYIKSRLYVVVDGKKKYSKYGKTKKVIIK
ncbi:MAG: RICIN domain-containing protein [Lachnospiraceae bacterium]|nr:RICIN domain-containing protein [Lachnospiraceae bacterium]